MKICLRQHFCLFPKIKIRPSAVQLDQPTTGHICEAFLMLRGISACVAIFFCFSIFLLLAFSFEKKESGFQKRFVTTCVEALLPRQMSGLKLQVLVLEKFA